MGKLTKEELAEIKAGNLSFCCERQRRRCPGGKVDFNNKTVKIVDDYEGSVTMSTDEFEALNKQYQHEKEKFTQSETQIIERNTIDSDSSNRVIRLD